MRYEFRLAERLPPSLAAAFPELTVSHITSSQGTVFVGLLPDQLHLHGLIRRFPAYGLTLVEMRRVRGVKDSQPVGPGVDERHGVPVRRGSRRAVLLVCVFEGRRVRTSRPTTADGAVSR